MMSLVNSLMGVIGEVGCRDITSTPVTWSHPLLVNILKENYLTL